MREKQLTMLLHKQQTLLDQQQSSPPVVAPAAHVAVSEQERLAKIKASRHRKAHVQ